LVPKRFVQPELGPLLIQDLLGREGTGTRILKLHDVARSDPEHKKDEDRDPEQGRDHEQEPLKDILPHVLKAEG
jgi:hypothetical protein